MADAPNRRGRFSKLEAIDAIRDARDLSKSEKLVLLMLVSRAKAIDGTCFPSLDTLADDCDIARSVVATTVGALRERAVGRLRLTVTRRGNTRGAGGRAFNLYQLTLSPQDGIKSKTVESVQQTHVQEGLSPKTPGVESEKPWGLSPAGGLEAGKKEAGKGSWKDPRVREVFEHWAKTLWFKLHQKPPKASEDRLKPILARLESFDVAELKLAIDHVAADDFMIKNAYIEPLTIFRNDGKAAKWIAAKPRGPLVQRDLSPARADAMLAAARARAE